LLEKEILQNTSGSWSLNLQKNKRVERVTSLGFTFALREGLGFRLVRLDDNMNVAAAVKVHNETESKFNSSGVFKCQAFVNAQGRRALGKR